MVIIVLTAYCGLWMLFVLKVYDRARDLEEASLK